MMLSLKTSNDNFIEKPMNENKGMDEEVLTVNTLQSNISMMIQRPT